MDSTNRRPQLPPVGFLDMEKARREEDMYQSRNASAPQTLPPTTAPSPYPSGPPPPYSHPPQLPAEHQSHAHPHYAQYRQEAPPQASYPPMDTPRAAYAESRPPLHLQTAQSPSVRPSHQSSQYPPPASQPSPVYEQPLAQSSSSMAPPQFPYGYQPYPPRYAQPSPQSSTNPGPIYQPSLTNAAPPTPAASWKSENTGSRFSNEERAYGDSVKRHLDLYDLEAALDQVTQTSSIMTDFARRYGDRLHQQSRSGPPLSSLPGMVEVEDMMTKSRLQFEALSKIREVVVAQQVAHDQQAAEQRQQQKAFAETAPPPPPSSDTDEARGGFASGDAKKRRGRAAPPGRCHSCNRAETPEWRRGPDGARTLCNACGLHYAKLTRKQNNANKNPAASSSNLRPKEAI